MYVVLRKEKRKKRRKEEKRAKRTVLRTALKKYWQGVRGKKKPPPGNRSIAGSINHNHTAGVLYKYVIRLQVIGGGIPNPKNDKISDLGECSSYKWERRKRKRKEYILLLWNFRKRFKSEGVRWGLNRSP